MSYGAYADDLLVILRSGVDARAGDQVLVLVHADHVELEANGTWDPMGMRGTCSPGFVVRATFAPEQVLAAPYAKVGPESMVPVSTSSDRTCGSASPPTPSIAPARSPARPRRQASSGLPQAQALSHLHSQLTLLRAEVASGLAEFNAAWGDRERLSTLRAVLRFNSLKIGALGAGAPDLPGGDRLCGIVGFKNDSPYSVGR